MHFIVSSKAYHRGSKFIPPETITPETPLFVLKKRDPEPLSYHAFKEIFKKVIGR
jgi:hypothetical protein